MPKKIELKALSYDNLIRLAENRGDQELAKELKNDRDVENYWNTYFKSGGSGDQNIIN